MVDCCGYRFCKECIMPLYRKLASKCPLCNCTISTVVPDKLLLRTLNDKDVYCTHKEAGCDWTGKLVTLDEHLNAIPDLEKRMEGCSVQNLKCSYCDNSFKRSDMMDHESKCPRRPITCTHCETFSAPEADMEDHWKECKSYPIQCENKCGEKIKWDKMAEHLKEHCLLTVIDCEYCDVTLPRKEMAAHMDQAAKAHLQLVTKKLTKQEEELKELASLRSKLDLVQKELTQKDVDTRQEITCKDDQLALKDKTIDLLKRLCDLRDDERESKNQVLVSNFGFVEDENVIKCVFGQFGRIKHINFYPWRSIAVIEFEVTSSVDRLFERYNTTGIKLRKVKLDCIRLALC